MKVKVCSKSDNILVKSHFKNAIGNTFFNAICLDETHQFFFETVIVEDFISKMLLESILDLRKCPNQKMHESESAGFLVWALP